MAYSPEVPCSLFSYGGKELERYRYGEGDLQNDAGQGQQSGQAPAVVANARREYSTANPLGLDLRAGGENRIQMG
jgi:hypothetical protein